MPYIPSAWVDGPGGNTPITASQLTRLETQYTQAVADAAVYADASVSTAVVGKYSVEASVRSFGAVGDGVNDDTAAIAAAIASSFVPAGAAVSLPSGDYKVSSTLTISKAITLKGAGRILVTHDNAAILVSSDGVTVRDITMQGRQRATWVAGARGISIVGTLATPRSNVTIDNVSMSQFAGGAIVSEFGRNVSIERAHISQCTYYGVAFMSCSNCHLRDSSIVDINVGGLPNAYGVTATRFNGDLATYPRSVDIAIENNTITDIPDWDGIDTHGGQRITARGNTVLRAKRGIDFVGSVGAGGGTEFAPLDCIIENNVVDGTGIATSHGIGLSGCTSTPGSPGELATGAITNNKVIHCGDDTNNSLGGIWLRGTVGVRIIGNQAFEPGSHGLVFSQDNYAFQVDNLTVTDPWSNTHTICAVVSTRSTYCTGVIGSFYGRRGSLSATTVLAYGLYQSDSATSTTVQLGVGCAVEAGALVAEASAGQRTAMSLNATKIVVGRGNGLLGFYGATPVTKQSLLAAATDAATTQALVNDIRSKLNTLGLTS